MSRASMDDIMSLARTYARARDAREDTTDEIVELSRKAVRHRLRALRNRIVDEAAAEDALRSAIETRPDLFTRPRTLAVDGVKFGYRKQTGAIEVGDEAKAIGRLRQKFPDREATLINVKETLDRKALRKLPAADLAKIGVTIDSASDEVFISVAPRDVDKVVQALLEDQKEDGA